MTVPAAVLALMISGCAAADGFTPSPTPPAPSPTTTVSRELENALMSTSAQTTFELEQAGDLDAATEIEVTKAEHPSEWARAFVRQLEAWVNSGGSAADLRDASITSFADTVASKYDETFYTALFEPSADASSIALLHREVAENALRAWDAGSGGSYAAALTLYDHELVHGSETEFTILLTIALRDNLGRVGVAPGGAEGDQVIVTDHRASVVREGERWVVRAWEWTEPF